MKRENIEVLKKAIHVCCIATKEDIVLWNKFNKLREDIEILYGECNGMSYYHKIRKELNESIN